MGWLTHTHWPKCTFMYTQYFTKLPLYSKLKAPPEIWKLNVAQLNISATASFWRPILPLQSVAITLTAPIWKIGNTAIMLSRWIWLRAPLNIIRTFDVHLWRQSVVRSTLVAHCCPSGEKPKKLAQIMAFSLNFTRKVRKLFAETFAVIAQLLLSPTTPSSSISISLGDLWPVTCDPTDPQHPCHATNEVGATKTRRGAAHNAANDIWKVLGMRMANDQFSSEVQSLTGGRVNYENCPCTSHSRPPTSEPFFRSWV